jgi:hypothetical protein
MDAPLRLELARLRCAERANLDDARTWRWYADMMEERRLACHWKRDHWQVALDGQPLAFDRSFDCALRAARSLHSETRYPSVIAELLTD